MTEIEQCFGPDREPIFPTRVDMRVEEYSRRHPEFASVLGCVGLNGAVDHIPSPRDGEQTALAEMGGVYADGQLAIASRP